MYISLKIIFGKPPTGLLEVKFSLPSAKCNYEVALLVNSSITNEEDCKNVEFHRSSAYEQEIHSEEKTVCVSNETDKLNCTVNDFLHSLCLSQLFA